jgi:glycosyltransferase involved in cell wall biosynthesis
VKILYVSFVSPWPPTSGISQRTNLIHRSLCEHGDVDTLALVDEGALKPGAMERLKADFGLLQCVRNLDRAQYGMWKYVRLLNRPLAEKLAHNLGRWDVIYGTDPNANAAFEAALRERSYDLVVGRYLISLTKAGALGRLPTILDVDDLDTELYRSRLRVPGTPAWKKWILRHHLSQMERIIPAKLAQCDAHWIASESDRTRPGMERARLLPNIPFDVPGAPPRNALPDNSASRTIIFIATMPYGPNVHAADFFISEVWPSVRAQVPDAQFHLIGSGHTDEMRRRWSAAPGVRPIGFVDDVVPHYANCAFTIAPIFSGGGTNIKVLESLAWGRTCVLTPFGLRGYEADLLHGDSVFVANDAENMARGCVELLTTPGMRQAMGCRGGQIVSERYSYERFRNVIAKTIGQVTPRRRKAA